ncbi:hypothetical protein [Allorhodopirellula heiligendammensis]|uniref:Uncharacterized protein n=1 Tax=Allorhodopirellula heiligendammensis TaxID=2714739 RepID=A0A5C6BWY9_9BACT|nr:hypothetical protein [Allorhodopirellula heiligendammensis]TWU15314.1 hypothetical protein Poly21_25090 [Allorhodopirellula heiligendammensis]
MTPEDIDASAPETSHPRFDASDVYEDVPDEIEASLDEHDEELTSPSLTDELETQASVPMESETTSPDAGGDSRFQPAGSDDELVDLQQPFVGRWNSLISTTNWEKGRIISQWRTALMEAGAPVTDYSDEAWASRVGGVTSPHVGRLRRVHDRFSEQAETYPKLYWSHFLAALDWDDAALWLQGAVEEKWSVSAMREQRWKANGAIESDRPGASQIVEVDLDEDTPDLGTAPAQGGSSTRDYDGDTDGVASGPAYEAPDFGDESELAALPEGNHMNDANGAEGGGGVAVAENGTPSPLQPFAGLPALPDDLADVIESLKLSILRHKTAGFEDVSADAIRSYLNAVALLLES